MVNDTTSIKKHLTLTSTPLNPQNNTGQPQEEEMKNTVHVFE